MTAKHPKQRRRRQAYLVDNIELGRMFRKAFVRGLKRLLQQGKLKLGGRVEFLKDTAKRKQWLDVLESIDWNVFIEGPPRDRSQASHMVRYLSRYLTGGPIADSRILSSSPDEVQFLARPKRSDHLRKTNRSRRRMARQVPHRLSGRSFMQRWCLHILPEGFTKTRWYGGYHGTHKENYLQLSRKLLQLDDTEMAAPQSDLGDEASASHGCPHCEGELELVSSDPRPSWSEVFQTRVYRYDVYCPLLHVFGSRGPP